MEFDPYFSGNSEQFSLSLVGNNGYINDLNGILNIQNDHSNQHKKVSAERQRRKDEVQKFMGYIFTFWSIF